MLLDLTGFACLAKLEEDAVQVCLGHKLKVLHRSAGHTPLKI